MPSPSNIQFFYFFDVYKWDVFIFVFLYQKNYISA